MKFRSQVAAMVGRVESESAELGITYTPKLRELERMVDAAAPERFSAALGELEAEWMTQIAKRRRLAAQGATP